MIVRCKMTQCPYYHNQGFCAKKTVLMIDEMGMCSVLWRRGQQKMLQTPFTEDRYPREEITVLNLIKKQKAEEVENAEDQSKKLVTEDPASEKSNEQTIEKKNDEEQKIQENDENESKGSSE